MQNQRSEAKLSGLPVQGLMGCGYLTGDILYSRLRAMPEGKSISKIVIAGDGEKTQLPLELIILDCSSRPYPTLMYAIPGCRGPGERPKDLKS